MAVASLIVAVVAIVIALASVVYARRQAIAAARQAVASEAAAAASEAAAIASKTTAALEGERRHEELTPELAITADARPDAATRWADLKLELTGPPGLGGLDEVMIRIRDDIPERKPGPGSQLTEEQVSGVIWGPYRFNPGMQLTDSVGRAHGPFRLPVHEPYRLDLEQTIAPSWSTPSWWRDQYEGKPVRVEVICTREGYEPWVVRREVEVKYPPTVFVA